MSAPLWIGTTGLTAAAKMMEVIGNNLANANTVGFKASDTYFASMLSQTMAGGAGGSAQVGQGVGVASVSTQFGQGSFESTGNVTDVAIDGSGYFIVRDQEGISYYTRAGNFRIQQDQRLTDLNKYAVQGYMFDAEGQVESTELRDITFKDIKSTPVTSTLFRIGANLDARAPAGSTFNAAQNLFDTLGDVHPLSINFTKMREGTGVGELGPGWWGLQATLSGTSATDMTYDGFKFNAFGEIERAYKSVMTPVTTPAGGLISVLNRGQMYKDTANITVTRSPDLPGPPVTSGTWSITAYGGYANASIVSQSPDEVIVSLNFPGSKDIRISRGTGDWATLGATASFGIDATETTFSVGTPLQNNTLTFAGVSIGETGSLTWDMVGAEAPSLNSFASSFRINSLFSDGYPSGSLSSIDIDKNGIIAGFFTNGQQQNLARIVLADFKSPTGLRKLGGYFLETTESGKPTWNNPGAAGVGVIQANSLEMSNTDVAKEFVKMITAQRAYQASARMITASDQMQQELMNIRR